MTILKNTAKLVVAVAAIAILTSTHVAQADTFDVTIGPDTYTIVEADSFQSGGSAGNTVRVVSPGTFWSTPVRSTVARAAR